MSSQPLFYKDVVPLSKETHGDWSFEPVKTFEFTSDTNSIYVAAVEFQKLVHEYPIVFCEGQEDLISPAVLLGLRDQENYYIDTNGEWKANYIPAYVRRYPFILATNKNDSEKYTVCIDESYTGFNNDQKGLKLFNDSGKGSGPLNNIVDFMRDFQDDMQTTTLFCKQLKELNILEPIQANVEMSDGVNYSVGGFMCVSRDRLNNISADKLSELAKSNILELIYLHLISLSNMTIFLKSKD